MSITDTQILSYYFRGARPLPAEPIIISSVTAAEFLLIQSRVATKANYYPILPSRFHHGVSAANSSEVSARRIFDSRKHAALGRLRTDQLILNFNGRIDSFIEFGSFAISELINNRHGGLFASSIFHLDKSLQKKLKTRFRFIIESNIRCVPATSKIADVGMNILGLFLDKYEGKNNARNTVNDVLILSTAVVQEVPLLTNDNLLNRFAAEVLNVECKLLDTSILQIDFSSKSAADRRKSLESKGYINRGWQVIERRGNR